MNKNYFVLAFAMGLSCLCSSCSNDEEPEKLDVLGTWECIESVKGEGAYDCFEIGDYVKFFDSQFTDMTGYLSGNKCKIGDDEIVNYTLGDWNSSVTLWGEDEEFPEIYTLVGNYLSVIECDADRWSGTVEINGDIMEWKYKYSDYTWYNYKEPEFNYESTEYYAKFKRVK